MMLKVLGWVNGSVVLGNRGPGPEWKDMMSPVSDKRLRCCGERRAGRQQTLESLGLRREAVRTSPTKSELALSGAPAVSSAVSLTCVCNGG